MSEESDLATTLQRLRADAGDDEAWAELVRRLWPYGLAVASHALGRRHPLLDAEGVVQEALLDLARGLRSLNLAGEDDLRKYMASLVHHRAVDLLRRLYSRRRDIRREQPATAEELDAAPSREPSDPAAHLRAQEELEDWQRMFARDALDRLLLASMAVEGLTQEEMAARWKVDASTVSRRMNRLRELVSAWRRQVGGTP